MMRIQTRRDNIRHKKRRSGFTLLEVLLVIAILGVLAAIVVPNLLGSQQKANIDATKASIESLESSLQMYGINHNGEMPQGGQEEMLGALLETKDLDGQAVDPILASPPKDAWGTVLNYRYPGTHQTVRTRPDIWSNGPDKKNDDGSGDDINNWSENTAE